MELGPITYLEVAGQDVTDCIRTPEPWALDHQVHVFAQTESRPGPLTDEGERWMERRLTGLALAVCNCGLNTGWIDKALMPDQATLADGDQHAALMARAVPIGSLRHPALRDAVADEMRRLARIDPSWARGLMSDQCRSEGRRSMCP